METVRKQPCKAKNTVWVKNMSFNKKIPRNKFPQTPSDTKLLLTKNYSEIIIFGKITNLTRNSLKMSFFPGHLES